MAFELSLMAEAESEYMEAVSWYKGQSLELADRFLVELADALQALENHPTFYDFYVKPYRRILLKSLLCKIVFEIDGNKVIIRAIYPTSRSDAELPKLLP